MEICNINYCTGCGACQNICPKDCINMDINLEGFYKYNVHIQNCINCGLCKKVCPSNSFTSFKEKIKTTSYLAWSLNKEVRIASSSGGVFSLLAEEVLRRQGVVFGAKFDENFNVTHVSVEDIHDLKSLRGSKYIQSKIDRTYTEAKALINKGKIVLYSGTPCQIAGLYNYLGKDYDNLITCDFICHGVSSIKVYQDVLHYFEKKYKSQIINIKFRDKRTGWKHSSVTIDFVSGKSISEIRNISLLTYGFASGLTNNRVCGNCKHAVLPRRADITLGDYGSPDYNLYSKEEIDAGISLVLVNSKKGEKAFEEIKEMLYFEQKILSELLKHQQNIYKSNQLNIRRDEFFENYCNKSFKKVRKRYLQAPFKIKLLYKFGVERYKNLKTKISRLNPLI